MFENNNVNILLEKWYKVEENTYKCTHTEEINICKIFGFINS